MRRLPVPPVFTAGSRARGLITCCYKNDTLTDDEARKLANGALAIEDVETKMRHTYFGYCQVNDET